MHSTGMRATARNRFTNSDTAAQRPARWAWPAFALFELIRKDPRHQRVEVLYQAPVERREFPDWVMGFVDLDGVDVSLLPGFSTFMSESAEPRQVLEELTRTRRMMLLFRAIS